MYSKISIVLSLFALCYIALLYFVVRSSYSDISNQEPFKPVIGQKVKTVVPVVLLKAGPESKLKNDLVLMIKPADNLPQPESIVAELPLNSEVYIQRAWLLTSGTSGFSTPFLSGEILLESLGPKPISFDYFWGTPDTDIWNKPDVYNFTRSFWQTTDPVPNKHNIKAK